MKLFKTRQEVKYLRQDINELRQMLVDHFGILYSLNDFSKYTERHPKSKHIPVTEGEWFHFEEIMTPSLTKNHGKLFIKLHFRGIPLIKKAKP
jgi:hypothetical protein